MWQIISWKINCDGCSDTKRKIDKEESSDTTKTDETSTFLLQMPPLEGNEEEVKEGKGLKYLTPNKLLTRLPILLAPVKAGNRKKEIRQKLYLLYQHNKIAKKDLQQINQIIITMEENKFLIRNPKNFYFNFDWLKDVDENL